MLGKATAVAAVWVAAVFGLAAFGGAASAGTGQGNCGSYLYDTDLYLMLLGGPAITVDPASVAPGASITISLSGWEPGSTVEVAVVDSAGVTHPVGPVTIDGESLGSIVWSVPANVATGPATVQATGIGCLEVQTTVEAAIDVLGDNVPTTPVPTTPSTTGQLPVTGSSTTGPLVGVGAALLVVGAAAVYGARRNRG